MPYYVPSMLSTQSLTFHVLYNMLVVLRINTRTAIGHSMN